MADLDARRIAAAGLRVVDRSGAEGFTMRAVADELGVTPMALYHHVTDKAGLVACMVDEAILEQVMPASTGKWREDLWLMARSMRQSMHAHPALIRLRREFQVWTPSVLPMTERWVSLWQQSGLGLERAVEAATVSSLAIAGSAAEEVAAAAAQDRPDEVALAMFPNARVMLAGVGDPDLGFELMVRSLIDGLYDRLSRSGDSGED
jgi:AcrR family transcriptional regulator